MFVIITDFFCDFSLVGCHSNHAVARPKHCHRDLNLKQLSLFLHSGASSLLPSGTMATWQWHSCLSGGTLCSLSCVHRPEGMLLLFSAHICVSPIPRLEQCVVGGGIRMRAGCCTACACAQPEGTELNQGYFMTVVCPGVTLGIFANQSEMKGFKDKTSSSASTILEN